MLFALRKVILLFRANGSVTALTCQLQIKEIYYR